MTSLVVGIIAKDEERDLPACLESIRDIADRIVLIDTGSKDSTLEIAQSFDCITELYTDASEYVDGQWRITDFSKARNRAIEVAERLDCEWYAWMDADDVLLDPAGVRRALYSKMYNGAWWTYVNGGDRFPSFRMWRCSEHVRFADRVHETPQCGHVKSIELPVIVKHDAKPVEGVEDANARNLRLLTLMWEENHTPRTAFYIANTHRDGKRPELAIEWYKKRIEMAARPGDFVDETRFAYLYLARALKTLKKYAEAILICDSTIAPGWAEFHMEKAFCLYEQGHYSQAIAAASLALDKPIPPTVLWRESNMYLDQPPRLIAWCHKHLGNVQQAIVWATLANERIDGGDPALVALIEEWKAETRAPAIVHKKHDIIALCRPGAIGDILMTLNLIPALKAANPGVPIWYFCAQQYAVPDALGDIILASGVDSVMSDDGWQEMSSLCERAIPLIGYPLHEGYPDKPMTTHLLHYFAHEMGLRFDSLPSLALPRPKRPGFCEAGPYVTLQRKAGWSKYKEWPASNWSRVIDTLLSEGIYVWIIDKEQGHTLAQSIAIFANARMHIGIDSFCNHLTNYRWSTLEDSLISGRDFATAPRVPGVILWGSTQASAAGYPTNVNISKGLACQPCFRENPAISRMPRGPCINVRSHIEGQTEPAQATSYDDPRPHICMDAITVDEVVEAVRKMWEQCK